MFLINKEDEKDEFTGFYSINTCFNSYFKVTIINLMLSKNFLEDKTNSRIKIFMTYVIYNAKSLLLTYFGIITYILLILLTIS